MDEQKQAPQPSRSKESQRSQNFRRRKGELAMAAYQDELDRLLFADFGGAEGFDNKLQIKPVTHSVVLPIATRGVGLIVSQAAERIAQVVPNVPPPVPELFRTALAQVTAAVSEANDLQRTITAEETLPKVHLSVDDSSLTKSRPRHLAPIALIVNQIGNFDVGDIQYVPRFTTEPHLGVTSQNLRSYVEEMANPQTPAATRRRGFDLNFIPGAEWIMDYADFENENGIIVQVPDHDSVRISNPNQIIPPGYNRNSMLNDYAVVDAYIARVGRKYPKASGTIRLSGRGNESLLVSTGESTLRLAPQNVIEGTAETWHFPLKIPLGTIGIGTLTLFGEHFDRGAVHNHVRSEALASQSVSTDWIQNIQAII